jgi:general secretion pathway protein D
VLERIYATEFDAAKGRRRDVNLPATFTGVDIPTPTSFEMNPVGARVEVDPVLSPDGKTIDLNLAPELTFDLGDAPVMTLPNEGEGKPVMTMPRIYSIKCQSSITLSDGSSSLLGVLIPQTAEGGLDSSQRVLVFVTARIVKP